MGSPAAKLVDVVYPVLDVALLAASFKEINDSYSNITCLYSGHSNNNDSVTLAILGYSYTVCTSGSRQHEDCGSVTAWLCGATVTLIEPVQTHMTTVSHT